MTDLFKARDREDLVEELTQADLEHQESAEKEREYGIFGRSH